MAYEVDVWGRIRRTVAASRQEAQATAADVETARLSLQAELVVAYFELRSADAQQRLLDATLKAYAAALDLTARRFEEGVSPKTDVALAQTQLDTTRAQATDIGVQRAQPVALTGQRVREEHEVERVRRELGDQALDGVRGVRHAAHSAIREHQLPAHDLVPRPRATQPL